MPDADYDAGRALAERLTADAMVEQVAEAVRVAQVSGHVEYKRRVGYHGRLTIARTVLDAICEGLEIPTSIDLLTESPTCPTPPAECSHGEPEGNCASCAACAACRGECGVCPYVTPPAEGDA